MYTKRRTVGHHRASDNVFRRYASEKAATEFANRPLSAATVRAIADNPGRPPSHTAFQQPRPLPRTPTKDIVPRVRLTNEERLGEASPSSSHDEQQDERVRELQQQLKEQHGLLLSQELKLLKERTLRAVTATGVENLLRELLRVEQEIDEAAVQREMQRKHHSLLERALAPQEPPPSQRALFDDGDAMDVSDSPVPVHKRPPPSLAQLHGGEVQGLDALLHELEFEAMANEYCSPSGSI